MEEARRFSPNNELDVGQILSEARNRWLRPPEICEILQNYQKFQISTEPPTTPASGSVFLFDRKVLRFFRKDGHNWRKKRDGKTVKEAHERLKAGSVDVLHCYYAHGHDNENFQRRSYWMLQEELSHIVFVHYLEVKGSRVSTSYNRMQRTPDSAHFSHESGEVFTSERDGYASGIINQYDHSNHSQATDSASVNGFHTPELEDVESAYNQPGNSIVYSHQHPASTGFDPYYQMSLTPRDSYQTELSRVPIITDSSRTINGHGATNGLRNKKSIDSLTWEEILLGNCGSGAEEGLPLQPNSENDEVLDQIIEDSSFTMQDFASLQESMLKSQDQELNGLASSEKAPYLSTMKQHLLDGALGEEGLKKVDSFSRWMSKELGELGDVGVIADANESFTNSSSTALDGYVMSPSLSKEQLFSIIDFAPNWTYVGCEVNVLVTGKFLKTREEAETGEWSCMFGQTEVPADVIADGILQCVAPVHEAGRVPFYVTCSNRLACSEVREFEYKVLESQAFGRETDESTACNNSIESLEARFVKLLCSKSDDYSRSSNNAGDLSQVSEKISLLLFENDDQLDQMLMNEISQENMKNNLLQEALKESLHSWLLQKIAEEGGKGPNVLDEGGQGILHFAAALGHNWALEPTIVAGVSVDFRDVNGWTALHWAAFFGRELVIGSLIALGASPGTLTDPNPDFPSGSTPSDLAYANGYKGIAGYLSEYALTAHVSLLSLNESNAETSLPSPSSSSLTDSLTAVRNATQAAARIHQVFRAQSFQKKQLKEFGDRKFGMSEERALSMLAPKTTHKPGRAHSDDSVQAAAIRIQNKFRGYKGRKDYLITRQRIIKIQAHVRGYQVRKNYRKIVWSVGILEKVILRWRRKGAGLRGFKSDALVDKMEDGTEKKEEDDDFFKQGRKQTEERLQKALARVKSMAQYPEARDQYRRLLNVVNDIQESKVEKALENSEEATCFDDDDLIDIEALLGDDDDTLMMPMSSTFWNT
ncbi:Calmodulin-binding transcription activator 3 [Raphanus sativus]|uniref:Calmodulin-binding transcription activator 3 isoform X2 n=1 Tax=Raphanus sativus TaxID=3726 RepID=A0A9W3BWM0_RAPSA|nr:calmodulin-binding transcription activator 3 isoform X2 [Raphanus sativus]KAJ4890806.1 Calmodulin-binding transcription activator 3 [Raphanus sativus]